MGVAERRASSAVCDQFYRLSHWQTHDIKAIAAHLIRAAAETLSFRGNSITLALITSQEWKYAEHGIAVSPLWQTGDMTIGIPMETEYGRRKVEVFYFNVRFDPAGIQAMLPTESIPQPAPQAAPEAPAIDEPEEQRGPPVSDDLLRAWFDLYQKAYRGSHDTTENARKSATGMFPGKFVSRERIRQLRGPKKPGRKAKEGDG